MIILEITENFLHEFLKKFGLKDFVVDYLVEVIYIVIALICSFILYNILKWIFRSTVVKLGLRSKKVYMHDFVKNPILLSSLKLIPAIVLISLTSYIPLLKTFADIVLTIYITFMIVKVVNSLLDLINALYNKYYVDSGFKPIKGLLSVIKIIIFSLAIVLALSMLLGKSPIYILTGLGAMSAVMLLIFKDSILGFVAGFQMSANDLIRIGDWIEMAKYGADGEVIDVSLTFVKVRNWDKTITTIPAYLLVSDSFINWRGMLDSGGRRIKRSLNIDVTSVRFCDTELLEKLSEIELINKYIKERQEEINNYNKERGVNKSIPANGRHLTNIGIFRIYVNEYLKQNLNIHKDMPLIVRQLQNSNTGVPIEIYAFSKQTSFAIYEGVIADIFDHLYAVVGYFGLRVFQEPSGYDIKEIVKK